MIPTATPVTTARPSSTIPSLPTVASTRSKSARVSFSKADGSKSKVEPKGASTRRDSSANASSSSGVSSMSTGNGRKSGNGSNSGSGSGSGSSSGSGGNFDEKKQRRREQNRRAAVKSRKRKKVYMQELEAKVKKLKDSNEELLARVQTLMEENNRLKKKSQTSKHDEMEQDVIRDVIRGSRKGMGLVRPDIEGGGGGPVGVDVSVSVEGLRGGEVQVPVRLKCPSSANPDNILVADITSPAVKSEPAALVSQQMELTAGWMIFHHLIVSVAMIFHNACGNLSTFSTPQLFSENHCGPTTLSRSMTFSSSKGVPQHPTKIITNSIQTSTHTRNLNPNPSPNCSLLYVSDDVRLGLGFRPSMFASRWFLCSLSLLSHTRQMRIGCVT
eukprot:1250367-Amorphochlora_amoeboformis.AAC.3